jgi:V/A-type H+-transporting ATPase subunit A
LILETARLLRQGFLQQNALDEVDMYSNLDKQMRLLSLILDFNTMAARLIGLGCPIVIIRDLPAVDKIVRLKDTVTNDAVNEIDALHDQLTEEIGELEQKYK